MIGVVILAMACGGGGGGSTSPITPPPPPVTTPEPPSNLQAALEQRPNYADEYSDIHVTWDSSPGTVDYYEIAWSYTSVTPGTSSAKGSNLVSALDLRSAWVYKGPELISMEIKARAFRSNVPSAWTTSKFVSVGPSRPTIAANFEATGAPQRAVLLSINRVSIGADQVRVLRAEGNSFSHGAWQPLVDLPYEGNASLSYTDTGITEGLAYIYKATNLKNGLSGDPVFSLPVGVYLFNPDPFTATVTSTNVNLAWKSWSKVATGVELSRADYSLQGDPPAGNRVLATGNLDLAGWSDTPYQPGYFAYYIQTLSPTNNRYTGILPIRYLGPQTRPVVDESILSVPFPYGIPGGAPSGPWLWFMGVDDHLEIYSYENNQWKTTIFPSVTGIVRPGVRINSEGQPYFYYRQPPNPQAPYDPGLQKLFYTYLKNGLWVKESVTQWQQDINVIPGFLSDWEQCIGPNGNSQLIRDIRSPLGDYDHATRQYYWLENGGWSTATATFTFEPYSSHDPQPFQLAPDGSWVQVFSGFERSIVFQSSDHGSTWTQTSIPTVGASVATPRITAVGKDNLIYSFFAVSHFSERNSPSYISDYELVCNETSNGVTGPAKHVLYYNHTGHALSQRAFYMPATGQVALLADPSTGLTTALQDSSGSWILFPVRPGEWRQADRLDTCLLGWEGNNLVLLADAIWDNNSVAYQKTVIHGPGSLRVSKIASPERTYQSVVQQSGKPAIQSPIGLAWRY